VEENLTIETFYSNILKTGISPWRVQMFHSQHFLYKKFQQICPQVLLQEFYKSDIKEGEDVIESIILSSNHTQWTLMERLEHEDLQSEGGDTLEQVGQGGCGCPIPGGIQGQAGCGSVKPHLVVGDSAHIRGVETRWSLWSLSTQTILWFYDMILCGTDNCKTLFLFELIMIHPCHSLYTQ